jgi:hypothetical protein
MTKYLNTPSRYIPAENYSWDSVVYQTGRPLLDADINLHQEITQINRNALNLPSGVLAYSPIRGDEAYSFDSTANRLTINAFQVSINNSKLYIAGTENSSDGANFVTLPEPENTAPAVGEYNKMLFVFLECWRAEVAPSTSARVAVRLANSLVEGDKIKLTHPDTTEIELEAGVGFNVGANAYETARNLADALSSIDPVDFSGLSVSAETRGSEIVVITFGAGSTANGVTVSLITDGGATTLNLIPTGGSDGLNMPTPAKVYKYGNVLCDSALYLDDNIIDPTLLKESARRVQWQYRIRVLDVDFDSTEHPEGFTHPDCFAWGVNTTNTTYAFSRQTSPNDAGLWVAGDGSSGASINLGSIDGYSYAIPLCMVSRRNTDGFNAAINANGGIEIGDGSTPSDRPDGKYADVVYQEDVLDMMRHVYPYGMDYAAETMYQFQSLLDENYQTIMTFDDPAGGSTGTRSVAPMICDEIGQPVGIASGIGDTSNRGNYIRNFDHIAKRFGSQPVVEYLTFAIFPDTAEDWITVNNNVASAGTKWYEEDEIVIDVTKLDPLSQWSWASGTGVYDVTDVWPADTYVTDVVEAWHNDRNSTTAINRNVQFASISGLGTTTITLKLDRNRTATDTGVLVGDDGVPGDTGSIEVIFLKLAVSYPANEGLTATPIHDGYDSNPNGAYVEVDDGNRPIDIVANTAPFVFFRQGFRDVVAYYLSPQTMYLAPEEDLTTLKIFLPVYYGDGYEPIVNDGVSDLGIDVANSSFGSNHSTIKLVNALPSQTFVTVTYYSCHPLCLSNNANGYQMAVYYKANAKQSYMNTDFLGGALGSTLTIKPLYVSPSIWVLQGGKGSVELGYPYYSPSEQLAVRSTQETEGQLCATPRISLPNFNIDTGVVSLSSLLPIDISGNLTFNVSDIEIDGEGRAYFKSILDTAYRPMSIALPLENYSNHKTALPFLARVVEDTPLLRRGEVVLVVLSRLSGLSKENKVVLSDGDSKTVACVYRTKNLMIVGD